MFDGGYLAIKMPGQVDLGVYWQSTALPVAARNVKVPGNRYVVSWAMMLRMKSSEEQFFGNEDAVKGFIRRRLDQEETYVKVVVDGVKRED